MPVKNNKAFSLSENTEGSSDPIRNTIQSFWTYDGSELTYDTRNSYNSTTKEAKTSLLLFDFQDNLNTEDNSIELDSDTTLNLKTYREQLDITPVYLSEGSVIGALSSRSSSGRIEADPESNFDSYIEDQIIPSLGVSRIEYKLDLGSPVEYASAVDNNSVIAGTVNFVYNYGFELYEDAIQEGNISESSLPNFYKIFPISNERPITKQRVIKRINGPFLNDFSRTDEAGFLSIQDFFMNSEGFVEALDVQTRKDSFPFYNEVYFTNPADTLENDKFRESLRDSGLIIAFCDLMNREDFRLSQDQEVPVVDGLSFANSYLSSSYEDATQTSFREQPALKTETVRLYDVPEMLKIMHAAIPKLSIGDAGTGRQPANQVDTETLRDKGFLTDGEQADYRLDTISKIKPVSNTSIDYENALDDLVSTINELTSNLDNFKNYKEILEGKDKTYQSDVLFYRIKKYEEGSDTPIQNFWIPAEKGYRGIRYIDTQVKYGKMYRYEICAFKFVMGSEYEFVERGSGVINFDEGVDKYENQVSETIGHLRTLSGFREESKEELSSVPFGSVMLDNLVYKKMSNYILNNDIDISILNGAVPMASGVSQIALFANNIIENGSAQYEGMEFSFDNLTEQEKGDLRYIQFAWKGLTNNWILGEGPTEKGTLGNLEKLLKSTTLISEIRRLIDGTVEGDSNIVIEDLKGDQLDRIRRGIKQLSNLRDGFSFDEKLRPDDSMLGKNGYAYYSFLDNDIAETFIIEGIISTISESLSRNADSTLEQFGNSDEEIVSILPISEESSKELPGWNRQGKLDREKFELQNFYYEYFRNEMAKFETIINNYLELYDNFIQAALSINVVLDYKRINKYSLIIRTKPTMKLAELPYYRSDGMILDNPPIYPNVNVVTYRGIADKLSFFMNSGQGEIEVSPITFSDEEEAFLSNYRKSRKLNDFQPILYKSDETENLGTVFEIRRLSSPPENYDSFRGARVVNTSRAIKTGNLPAATYDDEIVSNRKYYYIFRVADRRGTISYPTGVMEIEIVENSGIIYPVIKPYEFPKQKTDTTKNLKRLLNVVPRITQVLPPRDRDTYKSLTAGSTNVLGREEESLFGKQFKLRLTSKKTGKTVDLNLNFKTTVVETAEAE